MIEKIDRLLADARNEYPETGVTLGEPMSRHTTFRIGGPVSALIEPKSIGAFVWFVRELTGRGVPYFLLGNGSNLLVSDGGHEAVALSTARLDTLRFSVDSVICGAGVTLARAASGAREQGLTGMEFAHGIPGSVGGAIYMNAGAYGGEMRDIVESVTCVDPQGKVRVLPGEECGFGYRTSVFQRGGAILSATLRLRPGDPKKIKETMDDLMARRREKQPLNYPSAGSTFKRPENGYASKLIDEAGLKGLRVGDAQVSEKHAGFIVNLGSATFSDVYSLMALVITKVYKSSGVRLEPEVKIIL